MDKTRLPKHSSAELPGPSNLTASDAAAGPEAG